MSVASVLRGEAGGAPDSVARWGVLYRFVVRDAEDRPIAPEAFTIRRHLLHLSSSGALAATEQGALITVVTLDAEGGGVELVGVGAAGRDASAAVGRGALVAEGLVWPGALTPEGLGESGEDRTIEYFSFESSGLTCAIPRSGFVLDRRVRHARLEIARAPRATASIHGAVVGGLVGDGGGDVYVVPL